MQNYELKTVKRSEILNGSFDSVAIVHRTGEIFHIVEDVTKDNDPKKKKDKDSDWVKLYQGFSTECGKTIKKSTVLRLLLVLMGEVRYGNKLTIKIKEIGELLGVAATHITAAMKTLHKLGVVYPIKRGEWEISWRAFFKGDPVSLKLAQMRETDRLNATIKPKEFPKPAVEKKCGPSPQSMVYSEPDFENDIKSHNEFMTDQGDYDESQSGWVCDEAGLSYAY